jgi:tetratricopeptide (TPR) repeat protein
LAEAETVDREALAMRQKLLGSQHPDLAVSLNTLGGVLQAEGRLAEAETLLCEAMALEKKLPDGEQPDLADLLAGVAEVLVAQGKFAEAEPSARECLAVREKRLPDGWEKFEARNLLGAALLGQKKFTEAELLLLSGYEGMKEREERIPAPEKRRLKEALQRVVKLYEATGKPEEAAKWKRE